MEREVNKDTASTSDGTVSINQNMDVCKVGVRVPPFWPEEPEIWFAQVEGQFSNSGITHDFTKFNYVIGHLDNHHSKEVKDIIINPPANNKYEKLKSELIKRLSASNEKKIKQLLMHEELGDRKPSQFLRHLRSLAGVNVPDDFLRTIWTSRLPHGTQTVLAGQSAATNLEDLADLADRVYDLSGTTPRAVASVSDTNTVALISDLTKEVAELRREFQRLAADRRGRSTSRTSGHNRRSSSQRSQSNYRKFPICWYHNKYGDKASKCARPCNYSSENYKSGR